MCLALPRRVLSVADGTAAIEDGPGVRRVSLLLLDRPVRPGDYLLVPAGGFAAEILDAEAGRAMLSRLRALA